MNNRGSGIDVPSQYSTLRTIYTVPITSKMYIYAVQITNDIWVYIYTYSKTIPTLTAQTDTYSKHTTLNSRIH